MSDSRVILFQWKSGMLKQLGLMLMMCGVCFAQQEGKTVILEHADSLVGIEVNGERVRELIGNVRLRQGNTIITCDHATQYMKSNKVSLNGIVEVRVDTMRMVGARGIYYGDSSIAEAFDRVLLEDPHTILRASYGKYYVKEKKAYFRTNVYVEDTASILTADELTYYRDEGNTFADWRVTIVSKADNITIVGDHFENFKSKNYSKITGHPKVVHVESNPKGKNDTMIVSALVLESYQDSVERLVARDSVTMVRNGLAAESGLSVYYPKLDSMSLMRSPFVWYTSNMTNRHQVSGDTIYLKLHDRKLETVYVKGRAFAISRADTLYHKRFNQLSGQEIILRFSDNKIQKIDVNSTATSLYYVFDRGKGNGLNKTSGDRVTMSFVDGKIEKINVSKGVEGEYFPERMIKGREEEFNLTGFNWREDRPGGNNDRPEKSSAR